MTNQPLPKEHPIMLSLDEQIKVSDEALKEHYRQCYGGKRVPSDYVLMFTEGGESLAIAEASARAQLKKVWEVTKTIENPYKKMTATKTGKTPQEMCELEVGFEDARQKILELLKEADND